MGRVILFAPIGGIAGSFLGGSLWALFAFLKANTIQDAVIAAIQSGLGALGLTPFFTVPACLILGSPVIYAFRKQLVQNPIPWAALIAFVGTWIGGVCLGWAFVSNTNPEGLELLLLFSCSSAFSYASLYGWRTRTRQGRLANEV